MLLNVYLVLVQKSMCVTKKDSRHCLQHQGLDIFTLDATNNGDCPCLSHKLISAPELSKHLTTSTYLDIDARNNGDCKPSSHTFVSQSPLFLASMSGHCDVVKYLLSSGADINRCDVWGQSPLFVASEKGHCDVVKCLLSSGADINLRDEGGRSPLLNI
jgi:ankyrin repeat protein